MLVVELTTAIQGPAAGQYLRDMGAEVLRIEAATGDGSRHGRGFNNTLPRMGLEAQFISCNLGKKSLALDLKVVMGRKFIVKQPCIVSIQN